MAVDFLRANNREVLYEKADDDDVDGLDAAADRQEAIEDTTAATVVTNITMQEMLSRLKPAEREIVHLKIVGELTFEEIAALLAKPMGTVTWRYREAIKKLRRCGFDA